AIDFGILVDGAVVLVENVMHAAAEREVRSRGEMLALIGEAGRAVARPIFFALAIILPAPIPGFTLQRVEGPLVRPLAMTYSFALLGALVFALTTVPALCALGLRLKTHSLEPRWMARLRRAHHGALAWLVRRRFAVAIGLVALLTAGGVV